MKDNLEHIFKNLENKFDTEGKPKNNLTKEIIQEQMLLDITTALPERGTLSTTVFQQYPELLYRLFSPGAKSTGSFLKKFINSKGAKS